MARDAQPPTPFDALVLAARDVDRKRRDLLRGTDLAKIAHTEANIGEAVRAVRALTEQSRALLQMTQQRRGMYLTWLKLACTQHGEWQAFCAAHFPAIPTRSLQRWMLAYRVAAGEAKNRELPAPYDPEELDDPQLAEAVDDPDAPALSRAPRRKLLDEIDRRQAQIVKGRGQLAGARSEIEDLRARLAALEAGRFTPPEVADERELLEAVENAFYEFLKTWIWLMPADPALLQDHLALHTKLCARLAEAWAEELAPRIERKRSRSREGGGGAA